MVVKRSDMVMVDCVTADLPILWSTRVDTTQARVRDPYGIRPDKSGHTFRTLTSRKKKYLGFEKEGRGRSEMELLVCCIMVEYDDKRCCCLP